MRSENESTTEIEALLDSSAVSDELKQTLHLFLENPIEQAVEDAKKLEEVFNRRWEAFNEELIRCDVSNLSFHSPSGEAALNRLLGRLANIRCDAATTRLMKVARELKLENIGSSCAKSGIVRVRQSIDPSKCSAGGG
jgi:hypothetical protein